MPDQHQPGMASTKPADLAYRSPALGLDATGLIDRHGHGDNGAKLEGLRRRRAEREVWAKYH